MSGSWVRCSVRFPCPICGHTSWCSVAADGKLVGCRRRGDGAWKSKVDRTGAVQYFHRLDGKERPSVQVSLPAQQEDIPCADVDTLNRVYDAILGHYQLSQSHFSNLSSRGLTSDEIRKRRYGSLPAHGRSTFATELYRRFGQAVLAVPGLLMRDAEQGRYLTIAGSPGLLIPVRDTDGKIIAIKIRGDEVGAGGKYRSLSSHGRGGAGPGARAHVPIGVGRSDVVRITEGELKADVAFCLSGLATVSIPGVGCWQVGADAVRKLGGKVARVAFDSDEATNPNVAMAVMFCVNGLIGMGLTVEVECWPTSYKGIDDAIQAGQIPKVLTGDEVTDFLRVIVWCAEKQKRIKGEKTND